MLSNLNIKADTDTTRLIPTSGDENFLERTPTMQAREIRQHYLDFFKERGHLQLPSASLIPIDALGGADTSTLFTGSGMQQFKPYFTGAATPPNKRVTTVQKCVRVKDIDEVGDYSHCTFFEMLGNFSFGDYFKAEVIPWTWEFLTQGCGPGRGSLLRDRVCGRYGSVQHLAQRRRPAGRPHPPAGRGQELLARERDLGRSERAVRPVQRNFLSCRAHWRR